MEFCKLRLVIVGKNIKILQLYGPSTEINYAGNYISKAPRTMVILLLNIFHYRLRILILNLKCEHLGDYYTDETNSSKYAGHNLFNLRVNHELSNKVELYVGFEILLIKDILFIQVKSGWIFRYSVSSRTREHFLWV